jgi:hypothetical protein
MEFNRIQLTKPLSNEKQWISLSQGDQRVWAGDAFAQSLVRRVLHSKGGSSIAIPGNKDVKVLLPVKNTLISCSIHGKDIEGQQTFGNIDLFVGGNNEKVVIQQINAAGKDNSRPVEEQVNIQPPVEQLKKKSGWFKRCAISLTCLGTIASVAVLGLTRYGSCIASWLPRVKLG